MARVVTSSVAGAEGFGVGIRVENLRETEQALAAFDPKLRLALLSTIRKSVNKMRDQARSLAPVVTGRMVSGITVKRGRYREPSAFGYKLVNDTREGAILEIAGSASEGKTPQGASLINTLDSRYGHERFIWRAVSDKKEEVRHDVEVAIEERIRDLNARLEAV